jgi:hypothetical protein
MPGAPRWHWSDEPFSYTKLCYVVPGFVIAIWLLLSVIGLDEWLPTSATFDVALVGVSALLAYLFFRIFVWRFLPTKVRSRTPYDRKEANEQKGDVRSFWDMCKVLFSK